MTETSALVAIACGAKLLPSRPVIMPVLSQYKAAFTAQLESGIAYAIPSSRLGETPATYDMPCSLHSFSRCEYNVNVMAAGL